MARTTAKGLIIEILRLAGEEGLGKTKLFKAFYFAHVYYAKKRPEGLTDWPIARMPEGPGIHDHYNLFHGLSREGVLTTSQVSVGPYTELRCRLGPDAGPDMELAGPALEAVREAFEFCKDESAAKLSEITHEHSRAWKGARDGDILDVALDAIPDDEFEERDARLADMEGMLTKVFGVPA